MGFVCGKTGSGKGMFTKTEMTGTIFSNPTDEIYVIDRAGEYTALSPNATAAAPTTSAWVPEPI